MISKSLAVAKLNFRNMRLPYVITAIVIFVILVQDIILLLLAAGGVLKNYEDNMTVSIGNYFFMLLLLAAVLIPILHFRKMMNLGAKRNDFFNGCFVTYVIMAAVVSFLSVFLYYTYDSFVVSSLYKGGTLDILYWFGWSRNGAVVAFFQQFAFLLLLASAVHTLSAAQDRWYGWVADMVIIAIISVFTPIASLRVFLSGFFYLIIFNEIVILQIIVCLILAVAIYMLNKVILARKAI